MPLGGYIPIHPFEPLNPYLRKTGVMWELRRKDGIPKDGYPDGREILLAGSFRAARARDRC